jgi:hypothetical protein
MLSFEQIKLIKAVANIATVMSVTKVTKDIIVNNTEVVTGFDQARVWIGSFVIGGMMAESASAHVDRRIDGAIAWYANFENRQQNNKTEYKSDR